MLYSYTHTTTVGVEDNEERQRERDATTDRLGVSEEVSRHDEVLATGVQSHGEVFTPAVNHLQTLANALGVRAVTVDQLVGSSNQPQHSLLNFLRPNAPPISTSWSELNLLTLWQQKC